MISSIVFLFLALIRTTRGAAQSLVGDCKVATIKQNPYRHNSSYTVALHAVRDLTTTFNETRKLFGDYLTAIAGQKFDPPIQFNVVPYEFSDLFTAIENGEVDFVYANPGVFSCIGVQFGATPLATVVKSLMVRNRIFDIDVSGGVIAVRSDNAQINTIADLKDKIIAVGGIVDLMGGQLQMNEMVQAGLSYVNDPKQVVFTNSPYDIVMGVLDGTFDVGFLRSNEIETTKDSKGRPIDPSLFKIIDPKSYIMESGDMFPLLHSTEILPEWPFAALPHVPEDVQRVVYAALLDFGEHAMLGKVKQCSSELELLGTNASDWCSDLDTTLQNLCNVSDELLLLAAEATRTSSISDFRPPRSYFRIRNILEAAGFLLRGEEGYRCSRPDNLYDGITCPKGYFKRNIEGFNQGCKQVELSCDGKANYTCYCKPCVKAFEVDVYPLVEGDKDAHLQTSFDTSYTSCGKMEICGVVQQRESITLRIFDNLRRDGANVLVIVHGGETQRKIVPKNLTAMYAYDFEITENHVGAQVVEVFVDGQPISQSPIRVMVVDADCDSQYGEGSNMVPNSEGICVCAEDTYEMAGTCVTSVGFFLIIVSVLFAAVGILLFFYLGYKKKQSDSVWQINVEELHFNEPPEVIGTGTFGVVILGQYRGTKVAVKRVLPPANLIMNRRGSLTSTQSDDDDNDELAVEDDPNGTSLQAKTSTTIKERTIKRHVKFGHGASQQDIESRHNNSKSRSGSIKLRASMSGSNNKEWERLVMMNHSNVDVFKLLDAATSSVHGSGTGEDGSVSRSTRLLRVFPMWLRCDAHARRVTAFVNEMRMLSRLRHPCITTVMGAVVSPTVDPMLVMEYMEYGSLYDLLHNETMTPSGEIILQIARDVVQGIQFLHASRPPILHGDLKAKNILVDSRFRAKVADFGFSHFKIGKQRSVLYGTPFCMAPEYLKRESEYTTACDIYSLAMIFYEIYAKAGPFEGKDPRKVLPKICHPRLNKRPPIPESCPPKMVDLMTKCWSPNPFFRPAAKDIDYVLVAMQPQDMEPLVTCKDSVWENIKRKPTSLYDVFPKHVADALNAGKKVEAQAHEIVTVVFSDIVGFTTISQQCTPLKVANMLDRLYQAFDRLAHEHHVFKVETIGDAYMGVTNLEGSEHDTHVKQVAEYAQDAIRAASKIMIDEEDPSKGYVRIRVGFHCGPVVSNVIGSLNPRYGLFGDTVNTALSMESNSMPGRIHCSFAAAQLLQNQAPEITVSLRGIIKIQGKGKMKTYWVASDALVDLPDSSLKDPEALDSTVDQDEEEDSTDEASVLDDLDNGKDGIHARGHSPALEKRRVVKHLMTQETEMSESSSSDYGKDHFVGVHLQSKLGSPATKVGMDGSIEEVVEVEAC